MTYSCNGEVWVPLLRKAHITRTHEHTHAHTHARTDARTDARTHAHMHARALAHARTHTCSKEETAVGAAVLYRPTAPPTASPSCPKVAALLPRFHPPKWPPYCLTKGGRLLPFWQEPSCFSEQFPCDACCATGRTPTGALCFSAQYRCVRTCVHTHVCMCTLRLRCGGGRFGVQSMSMN